MGVVTGWEFVLLIVLAIVLLGPERLPDYAAKLARLVVQVRRMADDAKGQLKEQMGPEYEDINWRQYDPRQYDPRRIVRQALLEPLDDAFALEPVPAAGSDSVEAAEEADESEGAADAGIPWDVDAT